MRSFLSDPERAAYFSEKMALPEWGSDFQTVLDALRLIMARPSARADTDRFWYATESAMEYALQPWTGPVYVSIAMNEAGPQIRVFQISLGNYRLLPQSAWQQHVDVAVFLDFFQQLYYTRSDSNLYSVSMIGASANDILVGGDCVLGQPLEIPQPWILPSRYLAFLDRPEVLAENAFLVTIIRGTTSPGFYCSRSHAVFLRDLAVFAGLNPLSAIINAASGMMVLDEAAYQSRQWVETTSWIARSAGLRSLHVVPPLPKGLAVHAQVQFAAQLLSRVRLPKTRIYPPASTDVDQTVKIYAKNERDRQALVGPWAGTLRLMARYSGLPILVFPDGQRPWI